MYRTILLMTVGAGLVVGILLVFALVSSVTMTRSLAPAVDHLDHYTTIAELRDVLRDAQSPEVLDDVAVVLDSLVPGWMEHSPQSAADIAETADLLRAEAPARESALRILDRAIDREISAHKALIETLNTDTQRGLNATTALALVLPILTIAFLLFVRRRVLAPLHVLNDFLNLLARKEYVLVDAENVDPMLRPLFESYSKMVRRMHSLETAHVKREDALRQETELATRVLIEQQMAFGRTERLAAIGEVAARLSHELRNPLSGVLMALSNLRAEPGYEDKEQRLELAIEELQRMAKVLSRVLDQPTQEPEWAVDIYLRSMVDGLMQLAAYQVVEGITLNNQVDASIRCTLPEAGLRQALLNLVLNAGQVLAEKGGQICIDAKPAPDRLVIRVVDDGPGFPQDLLRTGVQEFGNWRQTGSGIGLVTATRFAFAQGGRLELSNLEDGGACASLVFPANLVAATDERRSAGL